MTLRNEDNIDLELRALENIACGDTRDREGLALAIDDALRGPEPDAALERVMRAWWGLRDE